jgi:cob(I)alamin adenosyltransferase
MRIYTRAGDDGSTGLYGGARVSKADLRVAAYGAVDELNCHLGWARAAGLPDDLDEALDRAQAECFRVGAHLASVPGKDPGVPPVGAAEITVIEREIDACEATRAPLKAFVLPGGCEGAARLHLCRAACRRAEREVVVLAQTEPVDPAIVRWLNRLSDLLFVQARVANREAGVADVPWAGRDGAERP